MRKETTIFRRMHSSLTRGKIFGLSYIRKNIKHVNTKENKQVIAEYFKTKHEEYFLGIIAQDIDDMKNQNKASLCVFSGEKQ